MDIKAHAVIRKQVMHLHSASRMNVDIGCRLIALVYVLITIYGTIGLPNSQARTILGQ